MFDPAKQNKYHVVIQREAVPDYDVAVVGRNPTTGIRVYMNFIRRAEKVVHSAPTPSLEVIGQ